MKIIGVAIAALCVVAGFASADPKSETVAKVAASGTCTVVGNRLTAPPNTNTNLIARLENPPRTRVVLSISGTGNFHREIVWDPTVGDSLKHDVLLPKTAGSAQYTLLAYADEDRVQAQQLLVKTTYKFRTCPKPAAVNANPVGSGAKQSEKMEKEKQEKSAPKQEGGDKRAESDEEIERNQFPSQCQPASEGGDALLVSTAKTVMFGPRSAQGGTGGMFDERPIDASDRTPRIRLECATGGVELADVYLDHKQLYAASVSRGFLDQAAPAVVTETLALLAEIAIERAKAGALEIVRKRFVDPICQRLDMSLLKLGGKGELAFRRTCAMLENMRLEDLLSSGRNLVDAARDDVRLTLVPALIARADIPSSAREVAMMALELGNKLLDGGNDVAEIDLLLTQVERVFARGALSSYGSFRNDFINKTLEALKAMGVEIALEAKLLLLRQILDRVLPADPGALLSQFVTPKTLAEMNLAKGLELSKYPACVREEDKKTTYKAADKAACIAALVDAIAKRDDWLDYVRLATGVSDEQVVGLLGAIRQNRKVQTATFEEWLESYVSTLGRDVYADLKVSDLEQLQRSCAVRVTVAIVKWCSGRDRCTANEIANAFDAPEDLFMPPSNPDNIRDWTCWNDDVLHLPAVRSQYVDLANRAFGFLTPPPKGEERKRIEAILRWVFDLARTIDPTSAASIVEIEEIFQLFQQRDYVRAMAQTMKMAVATKGCGLVTCKPPEELRKAMSLFGAVASYLQVYNETKTSDPAEAKAARKKAIESLIDSSTDRSARRGNLIISFGAPVGVSVGEVYSQQHWSETTVNWRIPLSLAAHYTAPVWPVGVHAALTIADLGNFLRGAHDEQDDDIRWKDFLQFGAQLGLTLGNGKHTVLFAVDAAWNPTLYRREYSVMAGNVTETKTEEGAWMLGFTLAYYVPFFDLN